MPVRTIEVLRSVGFREVSSHAHAVMPGTLTYSFSHWELNALECIGKHFREVVLMTGVASTHRLISLVEFEMPDEVESAEQGIAWLTYMLDQQAAAHLPSIETPTWLEYGRAHIATLPWERERCAYARRPQCFTAREWMRPTIRALRAAIDGASDEDMASFTFDGEALKISCAGRLIAAAPAEGSAWEEAYEVRARSLDRLPGRLMTPHIEVSVWKGRLHLARYAYPLAKNTSSTGARIR